MGTRWSALFYAPAQYDPTSVHTALQRAVDDVDAQMSIWRPDSELLRLNQQPVKTAIRLSPDMERVLSLALTIGRASGGAFDIGVGDAVQAWGFGPQEADEHTIRHVMASHRQPAFHTLELDKNNVYKHSPITLNLNGIAKGFGVDRLAETLLNFGIKAALVGIDGELRALGLCPDSEAWTVAIEAPFKSRREPHSIVLLQDAAIATSGDYRHWINVQGRHLSHTIDPGRGTPLIASPASVTVVAPTCAQADAWATALMVIGPDKADVIVKRYNLSALFLMRDDSGELQSKGYGALFS